MFFYDNRIVEVHFLHYAHPPSQSLKGLCRLLQSQLWETIKVLNSPPNLEAKIQDLDKYLKTFNVLTSSVLEVDA